MTANSAAQGMAFRAWTVLALLASAILVLALGLPASPAAARPFAVDDLLKLETFGQAAIDPSGRWLLFEKTDPYETAPRFDYGVYIQQALSRLYVVDLRHPEAAHPLLPATEGPGLVLGPFSPSGRRVAVFRLRDRKWDAGVVELEAGTVTWLGVTPEDALTATTLQWLNDREVLVLSRSDGRPPWVIRRLWEGPERLPDRWAATAAGRVAASVYGSGALRGDRPPPVSIDLFRIDAATGARRRLASGALVDLEVSPDGRHAALLENAGDLQPRADQPLQGAYGLAIERRRLRIVDLASGATTTPCTDCDLIESLMSWSADGRRLLVYSRPKDATWAAGRPQVYDSRTGRLTALTAEVTPELELRPETIRATWMGNDPVLYGRLAGQSEARADWFRLAPQAPVNLTAQLRQPPADLSAVSADAITLAADGAAWRIDAQGHARRLSGGAAAAPLRTPINLLAGGRASLQPAAGGEILTTGTDGSGPRLQSWSAADRPLVLPLPAGARLLAWSRKAGLAVALTREAGGVQRLHAISASGSTEFAVANSHLADVDPPRVREIDHLGPEGQPLKSWLFLPPPRADGRAPPLIVRAYLGDTYADPHPGMAYQNQLANNVEVMVGQGYAVLLPSLPKPADGSDFVDGLAERLLAIVDRAAADPALAGRFDPTRMALWGHSYGGYTTAVLIAQTDRFRAAIAQSGPMDLTAMFGTFQPSWRVSPEIGVRVAWPAGWTETSQGGMGGPPYAVPERYVKASPIFLAGRIHTPILMFYGDQDFIPPAQGEALFSALYRQDKDAELVTYWGEGHALASPGTVRDRYARSFAWLERFLRSDPSSAPAVR